MILAFSYAGYVAGAWGAVAVSVGAYAVSTIRRGRRLSAQLPAEDRRWS